MKCELCGFYIAQKHRIRPGTWNGTYDPDNVVYLFPNHHAAIHILMRWYFNGGRLNQDVDQDAIDGCIEDRPLYQLWIERSRPIVREVMVALKKRVN